MSTDDFAALVASIDAVEIAERIVRAGPPRRRAISTSAAAVVALALRLLALEDLAATAFELLVHIDELEHERGRMPREREEALRANAAALSRRLGEQLMALGLVAEADPSTEAEETKHEHQG